MPKDQAREHALSFIDSVVTAEFSVASHSRAGFFETAQSIVAVAAEDRNHGLKTINSAIEWGQGSLRRHEMTEEYQAIRQTSLDPSLDGGGPEGTGLALSMGYARVANHLGDANFRADLIDRVKSPAFHGELRSGLAKVERDFVGRLIVESERKRIADKKFAEKVDRAQGNLLELRPQLEQLGRRGDFQAQAGGETIISLSCILASWACVVVAVVVITAFIVVIVRRK